MANGTFTRDELVKRILEKNLALGEGQPPSAEQEAIVNGVIDPGLAELQRTGAVCIDVTRPMPVAFKEHLAEYLAFFCAKDFFRPPDLGAKNYAEARIRAIDKEPATFEPVRVEDIHANYQVLRDYRRY